ncbi:MAG: hypothetical protein NTW03_09080, partial [Verrucomicrobia bacterium]|nr:hypothetical protein [Verrucomicrobiota bacterium]
MEPVRSPRNRVGRVRGWLLLGAIVGVLGIALALLSKKDHRPPPAENSETKLGSANLRPTNPAPAAVPAAASSAPQTNPASTTRASGTHGVAT